jgi:hypothetical protein
MLQASADAAAGRAFLCFSTGIYSTRDSRAEIGLASD